MSRRNNSQLRDTDRLCLDQRLGPSLQRRLHHEVHLTPQMFFEPELEAHILAQARRLTKLDQDVHVTLRSGFIPGHGSKQCEGADTEFLLHLTPVRGKETDN